MRAKPTDANVVWLICTLKGKWSFDVRDVCRWLKCSKRTAQRYIAKLKEAGAIEQMLFLEDRYYQYRVRRKK
jgi:Mn-dependent DtxR family transcriptional regulator